MITCLECACVCECVCVCVRPLGADVDVCGGGGCFCPIPISSMPQRVWDCFACLEFFGYYTFTVSPSSSSPRILTDVDFRNVR